MKYRLTNDRKLAYAERKQLDRYAENAHLADCCVKLALAVFADEEDAKAQAEEILRDLNALPRPMLRIAPVKPEAGDITAPQREAFKAASNNSMFGSLAARIKGIKAALASEKTPAHLKAGLQKYLDSL
jgi:hypothetical protein